MKMTKQYSRGWKNVFRSHGRLIERIPRGGGCFIATAAYGTGTAKELCILKDFRDNVLLKNKKGASFVNLYYTFSPPIAKYIQKRDYLRFLTRCALYPLISILKIKNIKNE